MLATPELSGGGTSRHRSALKVWARASVRTCAASAGLAEALSEARATAAVGSSVHAGGRASVVGVEVGMAVSARVSSGGLTAGRGQVASSDSADDSSGKDSHETGWIRR